jgi:hypothetical protein
MDDKFLTLLKDFAEQLPSFLAILGCMIFALVRWKRHPKVSLVVIVALLILLVQFVLFTIVYTWVPDWFIDSADAVSRATVTRNVYLVLGIVSNTVLSIGLAVLLVGIFMRRDPPGLTRDLAPETSPTIG